MSGDNVLPLTLEFRGGAENLFGKVTVHEVELDTSKTWTVGDLLEWMKDNMIKERPELFFKYGSVRPGILVLINETDWELMDELNYRLQAKDHVMFISTLHGG